MDSALSKIVHAIPYGGWLSLAAILAVTWIHLRLVRSGDGVLTRPWLIGATTLGAGLGGRLHFVLERAASGATTAELLTALDPTKGGSTFFGAALGGAVGLGLARSHLPRMGLGRLADLGATPFAASIFVGRMGCLVAGCCVGLPTDAPWGWSVATSLRVHPLPVYLGLWALVAAAAAAAWTRAANDPARIEVRRDRPGVHFWRWAFLFSVGRAALESFRWGADADVNPAQVESVILASFAVGWLGWVARSAHNSAQNSPSRDADQLLRARHSRRGHPSEVDAG